MLEQQERKPLLPPDGLAERLSIFDKDGKPHGKKVLQYAREGKIPSVRLSSKCIRFDLDAVEAALLK
jgi:hypothetical protein